uniref:Ig-like domain-containing protein n=1 Tax=Parastrongyloides trichosuri TaxID=131310 RepID=A0A0N5A3Z5_PARTI
MLYKTTSLYNITFIFLLLYITILLDASHITTCCKNENIPSICVKSLCDPGKPPDDIELYEIFESRDNCAKYLPKIAKCIADGRNHSYCCHKEAIDSEQKVCFDICLGYHDSSISWTQYQTCLSINLNSMYKCFRKNYETHPGPPMNLRVSNVEKNRVKLLWSIPHINSHSLRKYKIKVVDLNRNRVIFNEETSDISIIVMGLKVHTQYQASVVAVGKNNQHLSLESEKLIFEAKGHPPKVKAYLNEVHAPLHADKIVLSCRISNITNNPKKVTVEWKKENKKTQSFESIKNLKYSFEIQTSEDRKKELTTILIIKNIESNDYVNYKCIASNEYGIDEDKILLSQKIIHPPSQPPPSIEECCEMEGIPPYCMTMCGREEYDEEEREMILSPKMKPNCESNIYRLTKCFMRNVEDGSCCLKLNIPYRCMYMCDRNKSPTNLMPKICLNYINEISECRMENENKKPTGIEDVVVSYWDSTSTNLQWPKSENTDYYAIYWRKNNGDWQRKMTSNTNKKVSSATQIVLIPYNIYGSGYPYRLNLIGKQWVYQSN